MNIYIVLAAYNGTRYIREQINSIRDQTFKDWILLIRDDGSSDGTPDIVREIAKDDKRIQLVEDSLGNQGPVGNFALLLQHASDAGADYVFLCDQDDVWLPNKISDQLSLMQRIEQVEGANTPILVHSDLVVTDERLITTHKSFMACEKLHHEEADPLSTLLVQNFVTGCTAAANRSLVEFSLPVPAAVFMHDWWLALCAASAGKVVYLPEPTVLYRQHEANVLGARGFWSRVSRSGMTSRQRWARGSRTFIRSVIQANELRERLDQHGTQVRANVATSVKKYCQLFENHTRSVRRLVEVWRMGIRRQNLVGNLSLFLHVLVFQQDLYRNMTEVTATGSWQERD